MESAPAGEQGEEEQQISTELLARVRELTELQRQLEGLEQVTATLQAATSRADRASGPSAAGGGRPRDTPGGHRPRGLIGPGRHRARAAEETGEAAEAPDEEVHPHITCDGCHAGPTLRGRVMHCADCEDFDLCAQCYPIRDQLGHDRSHNFHPRDSSQHVDRRGSPSQLLLMQMLESAMLGEALRRSVEGDPADEAAANEARGAELLASFPCQTWSPALATADASQGNECALCLDEYEKGDEVVTLPCTHFFHVDCVRPWFAKSVLCPLCQRDASSVSEGDASTS